MRSVGLNFLLCACVLMLTFSCETESTVDPAFKDYFIKYYGGDGNQEAKDFVINADGTVVMVGTWTDNFDNKRVYLVKTNTEGTILWDKKLGSPNDEYAADIELITQGPDAGNLVVLSNYTKNAVDSMAIRLTIVSQAGDSLKSRLLNFYDSQIAKTITSLSDGGYYVSAKTSYPANTGNPSDPTEENLLVIRLLNDLNLHPISGREEVFNYNIASVVKIFRIGINENYYAGYSDADSDGNRTSVNFFFRKFETDPRLSYSNTYAGVSDGYVTMSDVVKSPSGQFIAIGTVISGSDRGLIATRVSSSFGTASPMQNILSNAEGVAVAPSGASDFLLLGNVFRSGGNRDIYIQKVDFNIGEIMTLQFGSTNNDDTGSAIAELPNGDILILGTMELVNQKKMALIRVKPNGTF
jgi:hypothetical protein